MSYCKNVVPDCTKDSVGYSLVESPDASDDRAVLLATLAQDEDGCSTKAGAMKSTTNRNARRDRANKTTEQFSEMTAQIEELKSKLRAKDVTISRLTRQRDTARLKALEQHSRAQSQRRALGLESKDEEDLVESSSDEAKSPASDLYEESEAESYCSESVEEELDDCGLAGKDRKYKTVQAYEGLYVGMPLGPGHVSEIWPGIDRFMITVKAASGGVEVLHHSISTDAARMLEGEEEYVMESAVVDPHASHRGLPYLTNAEVKILKAVSIQHARLVVNSQLCALQDDA